MCAKYGILVQSSIRLDGSSARATLEASVPGHPTR
jgi:hypothetical protein